MTMPNSIFIAALLIATLFPAGCRAPAPTDDPVDSASEPTEPLAPCAPGMDPALGLLPENSPAKGGTERVDVVVNVFSSLVCPHCAALAETLDVLWKRSSWNSRVRLYFRHMPVSLELHAATVAAFNQREEAFWALQDEIYYRLRENGDYMSMDEVRTYAAETLGLDMAQFESDLVSDETAARLQTDRDIGEALSVTGTPSVFVCDEKIPTSDLETVVSEYL